MTYHRGADSIERGVSRSIVAAAAGHRLGAASRIELLEVEDTARAIRELEALPWVASAEPDRRVRSLAVPNDQFFGLQWGMNNTGQVIRSFPVTAGVDIDAPEAWDITTGDPTFVVAVIDEGIQLDHPDLQGSIWVNADEIPGNGIDDDNNGYIDDVNGWDFYDNDNDPDDLTGHGTHVSGIVAAKGNNTIGVAGVAWDCKVMPLRFIGLDGGFISDAILALEYAIANGARVSNNSWGEYEYSDALNAAIEDAALAGHLFVAAAGNDGIDNDAMPLYPASYDSANIISVANMTAYNRIAVASNRGATTVDLGAPGNDVASTWINSDYVYFSGTSMAAPHVSAVAALMWSVRPGLTVAQVKDTILATVRPAPETVGLTATGGMVNAFDALTAALAEPECNADVTSTGGTIPGSPGYGNPDGVVDLDDLGYIVDAWISGNTALADLTTGGATLEGQPGFGVPDGSITIDDLGFYLNIWRAGCP
ncbi:MAG: S8 family peptidase [Planctomycetota bacterium]